MRYFIGVLCFLGCFVINAHAALFSVNSLPDVSDGSCSDGTCSLRDAITLAVPGDEIHIVVPGTIALQSALPNIFKQLTIAGMGEGNTIIDGNGLYRPFYFVNSGVSGTLLKDLTITGGNNTAGSGGAVLVENAPGGITFENITFTSNKAPSGAGGAIASQSTPVTVENCTFGSNRAKMGAAIWFLSMTDSDVLTIKDSYLTGNATTVITSVGNGGAVYCNGPITITGSSFFGNSAGHWGGAVYLPAGSNGSQQSWIDQSRFQENHAEVAGGAVYWARSGKIERSLFRENWVPNSGGQGGGLVIKDDYDDVENTGTVVENSTFSANSASAGGGLYVDLALRDASIISSTIAENICIETDGVCNGGGIAVADGNLLVKNAIIIKSECDTCSANDCQLLDKDGDLVIDGNVTSYGYNTVVGTGNCTFTAKGDRPGLIPLLPFDYLGALADNGGPTMTHALGADYGDDASCTGVLNTDVISTDQRGLERGDGACDRGAYEITGYYPLDMSGDLEIGLEDAVLALQIVVGLPADVNSLAALSPDKTVGVDETIAILKKLAQDPADR